MNLDKSKNEKSSTLPGSKHEMHNYISYIMPRLPPPQLRLRTCKNPLAHLYKIKIHVSL